MLCVHSSILLSNFTVLLAHLSKALIDVLEVDAEHVVFDDLRVVVLDNVFVFQLLVAPDLLLHGFDFLLVQPKVGMHKLDHLDRKSFACVDIESLVDFSSGAVAELLAHLPLYSFAVYLLASRWTWNLNLRSFLYLCSCLKEVVLLLDLLFEGKQLAYLLCLLVVHVKFLVNHLNVRCDRSSCQAAPILSQDVCRLIFLIISNIGNNLNFIRRFLQIFKLLILLLNWRGHCLIAIRAIKDLILIICLINVPLRERV